MVRIRLRRMGAKHRPFYRVVVTDQRNARDGRFIEIIGKYHPMDDPSVIDIDAEKALAWLDKGAQPSDAVRKLLEIQGIWQQFPGAGTSLHAKRAANKVAKGKKMPKVPKSAGKKAEAAEAPAADAAPEAPAEAEAPEAVEAEASS